jgi:superfamily I DNA/RNA helicase
VVRGAAGSGKTIVGVRRIERIIRQRDLLDTRPVLFTCYNKVLAHAVRQMLEATLGQDLGAANVHVVTAFKLMSELQMELEGKRFARLVPPYKLLQHLRAARRTVTAPSLAAWTDEHILDEILEVVFGRGITSQAAYVEADRTGRGRQHRLDTTNRRLVWKIYRAFRDECDRAGLAPWDQLPARVLGLLEKAPRKEAAYAAIVVDEAQDLPPSIIRVLLQLQAGQDRNMVILGDAAQNVYRSSFRWAHTGLKVAGGQVATLRRCFRSTPSIIGAATPLISCQDKRLEDDLTLPEPWGETGPPVEVRKFKSQSEELQAIAQEIALQIEGGVPPSSIGVLCDEAAARKELSGLLAMLDCRTEDYFKDDGAKFIDIFDPSVKLLTSASSKGLEFQLLFIPAVNEVRYPSEDEDGETADRARRSLYTAMARCAYDLRLSSTGSPSRLLGELDKEFVKWIN